MTYVRRNLSTSEHLDDNQSASNLSQKTFDVLDSVLTEEGSFVFISFQFEDGLERMRVRF